jgi:hypothetical protein
MTTNITIASDDREKAVILSEAISEFLVGKGFLGVMDYGSNANYSEDDDIGSINAQQAREAHTPRDGAPPSLLDRIKEVQPNFEEFMLMEEINVSVTERTQAEKDIADLRDRLQLLSIYRGAAVRSVDDVKGSIKRLVDFAKSEGLKEVE